jgi:hypothetical protein
MDELQKIPYTSHHGYQKIITTTKKLFNWLRMKKDIVDYLDICLECQKVKAKHRHLARLLQPLPIPEWKWETISMDFITVFPKSTKKNDTIMVVVDKLRKVSHFIPVKSTCKEIGISNIFMKEIFRVHGMPKEIISDIDTKFSLNFWKSMFACFDFFCKSPSEGWTYKKGESSIRGHVKDACYASTREVGILPTTGIIFL